LLENKSNGKFFRLGVNEVEFVEALTETASPHASLTLVNQGNTLQKLSLNQAHSICQWLVKVELAELDPSASGPPPSKPTSVAGLFSAVYFCKIPVINPDRFLLATGRYVNGVFSPPAMAIMALLFAIMFLVTLSDWDKFVSSYENLFVSWRWLWMLVAWVLLKAIHEFAHAATCRRYGGEVDEAGLAMILLMPIAYVNVTSSWRFVSRFQRLHVTLAGVTVELAFAAFALLVWHWSDSSTIRCAAADMVLMASVSSLLFNLNPLLKFDGYFALADLTGVDNLYDHGRAYARYFGARYILGLHVTRPRIPGYESDGDAPLWIKAYGIAAAIYRVFTTSGLMIAAAALFNGIGIVFAIAGAFTFVGTPIYQLFQHLNKLYKSDDLNLTRLSLRLSLMMSAIVVPVCYIPATYTWTVPGVIEYDPPVVLRTRSGGFVKTVHVGDGQAVSAGQKIVTLENRDLELRWWEVKTQVAQVEQEVLAAQWHNESSELHDAMVRKESLLTQLTELQSQVDHLVLRAPCDGLVLARQLRFLQGSYVEPGDEIAVVGNENRKRIKISVAPYEAARAEQWINRPVRIVLPGVATFESKAARIETMVSKQPAHESLVASNGGSLSATVDENGKIVLCEPRVNAYVPIASEQAMRIRAGQRAHIRLDSTISSLGSVAWTWMKQQLTAWLPSQC